MRQQHVVAGPHQLAAVTRFRRQPLGIGHPMPLLNEPVAMLTKWSGQRADCLLQGGMVPFAKPIASVNSRAPSVPAAPRFSSPNTAILPFVAEPNSQSIWKLSLRSRHPSLEPTNPQLTREKPQLAPIASDHWFFHASSIL